MYSGGMDISPDEDLVTPERRAKGDLEVVINIRGKVSRAIPARLTILKDLIQRGVTPYHYEIYATGFLELRNAFRSPWAVRSSAVLLEQWGIGVSNGQADSIYQAVCRGIGSSRIEIIQYVSEAQERRIGRSKPREVERRREVLTGYKEALERLVHIMDEERERALSWSSRS